MLGNEGGPLAFHIQCHHNHVSGSRRTRPRPGHLLSPHSSQAGAHSTWGQLNGVGGR